MEAGEDKLRDAYKTAAIISISMMAAIVVYVVVAVLLNNLTWKGIVFSADSQQYSYLRYALLALAIVIPLVGEKILAAVYLSPEKLANPIPALVSHSVMVSFACDFVGMFGIVLFLLAGNIADSYIFGAIALGYNMVFFPKFSRWKELAESQLGGPTFE